MGTKQSGSALLLSLMVLALVSAIATSILISVQNEQSITGRVQLNNNVKQQLLGGEAWAKSWLNKESILNRTGFNTNSLNIPGLAAHEQFKTDVGFLDIYIFDLQACININLLRNTQYSVVTSQRLATLSTELGISNGWVSVVSDWMDVDQTIISEQGREDDFYLSKQQAYRTSAKPLLSGEELALLDIPEGAFNTLVPYLCALPENVGLNVNRAPAVILKSYLPELSAQKALTLTQAIRDGGFDTVDTFQKNSIMDGITITIKDWSTVTRFVSVYSKLTIEDDVYWLHSRLNKDVKNKVLAFYRSFSPLDSFSVIKLKSIERLEQR